MQYLLDTNVLSEGARPRPDPAVMAALEANRAVVCTAAVVVHELRYGVARLPAGRRREQVSAYVDAILRSSLLVLPYDDRAARWHADQRATADSAGRGIGFADGMVAATAAVYGLSVVTRDVTGFAPMDVPVVSWWRD
ncbi:MAG: PIN domain-containing protein [Euzebya sp.]